MRYGHDDKMLLVSTHTSRVRIFSFSWRVCGGGPIL